MSIRITDKKKQTALMFPLLENLVEEFRVNYGTSISETFALIAEMAIEQVEEHDLEQVD